MTRVDKVFDHYCATSVLWLDDDPRPGRIHASVRRVRELGLVTTEVQTGAKSVSPSGPRRAFISGIIAKRAVQRVTDELDKEDLVYSCTEHSSAGTSWNAESGSVLLGGDRRGWWQAPPFEHHWAGHWAKAVGGPRTGAQRERYYRDLREGSVNMFIVDSKWGRTTHLLKRVIAALERAK
jgi:hypothetical protein